MLDAPDLDHAVAQGAAYYGLARRGRGIRIRSGAARSYYVGIESAMPAVPGLPAPLKALCVVPFGMEEGTSASLPDLEFGLVVGEPAEFRFLSSHVRKIDPAGTLIEDWGDDLEELSPLEVTLPVDVPGGPNGDVTGHVPVTLESRVTEIGTLELWCVARERDQRWKLELNIREREPLTVPPRAESRGRLRGSSASISGRPTRRWPGPLAAAVGHPHLRPSAARRGRRDRPARHAAVVSLLSTDAEMRAGSLPSPGCRAAVDRIRTSQLVAGVFARDEGALAPGAADRVGEIVALESLASIGRRRCCRGAPRSGLGCRRSRRRHGCSRTSRDAWNHDHARTDERARLTPQQVVLTVPASFDEEARELTVEAAQQAGLGNLRCSRSRSPRSTPGSPRTAVSCRAVSPTAR